jgi:hypothetical protein
MAKSNGRPVKKPVAKKKAGTKINPSEKRFEKFLLLVNDQLTARVNKDETMVSIISEGEILELTSKSFVGQGKNYIALFASYVGGPDQKIVIGTQQEIVEAIKDELTTVDSQYKLENVWDLYTGNEYNVNEVNIDISVGFPNHKGTGLNARPYYEPEDDDGNDSWDDDDDGF